MQKLRSMKSGLKSNDVSTRDLYIDLVNKGLSTPDPGGLSINGLDRTFRHLKTRGYIEGGPKRGYRLPEPVK